MLQPFFHAMEEYFANLPRYGRFSSTLWKKEVFAPARAIPYPDLGAPNPAQDYMKKKEQNKRVQGMSHKVRHPLTRDVGAKNEI